MLSEGDANTELQLRWRHDLMLPTQKTINITHKRISYQQRWFSNHTDFHYLHQLTTDR